MTWHGAARRGARRPNPSKGRRHQQEQRCFAAASNDTTAGSTRDVAMYVCIQGLMGLATQLHTHNSPPASRNSPPLRLLLLRKSPHFRARKPGLIDHLNTHKKRGAQDTHDKETEKKSQQAGTSRLKKALSAAAAGLALKHQHCLERKFARTFSSLCV